MRGNIEAWLVFSYVSLALAISYGAFLIGEVLLR